MAFETPQLSPAAPEMFVLGMACVVLLVDAFLGGRRQRLNYWLAQATLVGAWLLTVPPLGGEAAATFGGAFVLDPVALILKSFIYLTTLLVFLYSYEYLRVRELLCGEYYVLGLFAVLGMMVMVSGHSFLTLYLGLELLSLSLYAMVALHRDSGVASEAAMKYFVLGALASGMLLYGMSMLYGATGTLDIGQFVKAAATGKEPDAILLLGLVFTVVGIAFKFGAVPFHMWVPDVYHGAPTSVTLLIGSAPKLAAFALILRLLVEALGFLAGHWQDLLAVLAVLSLAVGNVIAIAQTNIKRMLAYSTIGHMGFLLLGFFAATEVGYGAAFFYVVVYALMAAGGFGMVIALSRAGFEAEELEDFRGLNARSPWFAFIMLLLMFSMAGVPPTVGFYAKLVVLQAVVDVGQAGLAALAVVFSVIGAFYYLRVVRLMYFESPQDKSPVPAPVDVRVFISANGLAQLLLGVFPGVLLGLCIDALQL
jgi:NADH-quinone oxidoreductase subunit N